MSNTMNRIASDLQKIMSESDKKKTSGFDTQATVTRLDGDIAWVQFPGGEDETPVRRTTNAVVGDNVQVRVNGGRAWLLGNTTNPPTDDTVANVAMDNAKDANQNAAAAGEAAAQAMESAAIANDNARIASAAAAQAQTDAGIAHTAANEAKADAAAANTAATQAKADAAAANTAAGEAKTAANEAKADARAANTAATEAKSDAARANTAANDSLSQLSIVEDVVGTLNWITTHATYKASADTEVHAGKWYFTKSGNTYNVVTNPTGNPSAKGYYEVDTIDEAVSNYVASHLALTSDGLYLTKDGNGYKILLANDGLKVYDPEGHLVSTFGESIIFDSARPQTIGNNNVYIKYYDKNNDGTPDSLAIKADEFLLSSGKTIQEELEGVENWFYSVAPTTSNPPASSWTTDKLKEQHLRDIYFDTTSGKSYRWAKDGTTYKWVEIEDVELAALAKDLHDNYPPRSEFTVAPDKIQSTVSAAQTAATNAANTATDNKLKSYSTTTQMNSAIEQKAGEITASVSSTYETKSDATSKLNAAKGYTDSEITSAKAEIKVTTDGISTEVSKKVGASEVISKINQSAETVKIQASKVEIDGTATFNAIKASADAAYDAKGAASTAEANAKNAIPTKVSQLTNDSGYQNATQVSNAVTTGVSGKADKTAAVAEEQYIYISKASGTTSVSGTTTWITEAGDKQNTWTTKRPTYNTSYPVLFVAKQKKVVSGTVTCTTPVKDDTTTVIDGGHITTGTIDSNRLNADTIKVNAANIQGSLTIGQLPSTVAETSDIPTKVSQLTNDSKFQTDTQVSTAVANEANARKATYATSSTAAGTQAKVAACSNFALYTGATITVGFTNANTHVTPTLNVNSTGAKTIKNYTGAALTAAEYKWAAGAALTFVYDGSYWRMQDSGATESKAAAAASASTASTKASEAATSASTASTKASEAATSASTASTKASEASTSASTASSKATAAANSASTASTKASEASTSASTASSKATAAANSATAAENAKNVALDTVTVKDTRNDNRPPSWYISNYPKKRVQEFKSTSKIGLSGDTYCWLQTDVPWADSSGGYPKQMVELNGKQYWRQGTSTSAWSAWVDAYGTAVESAKTATTYITDIDSKNGITIKAVNGKTDGSDDTKKNYIKLNADGLDIYKGGASVAKYGDTARIGKIAANNGNVRTTSDGMDLYVNTTKVGSLRQEPNYTPEGQYDPITYNNALFLNAAQYFALTSDATPTYSGQSSKHPIMESDGKSFTYQIGTNTNASRIYFEDTYVKNVGGGPSIFLENSEWDRTSHVTKVGAMTEDVTVWVGVGAGGDNHGVYSDTHGRWLVYMAADGYAYAGIHFSPGTTSTSTSTGFYLGLDQHRWRQLYSYSAPNIKSDRKDKDVVGNLDYAKEFIMSLKPIEFQWKDSDHKRIHMGFIAQDVAEVGKKLDKDLSVYEAHYKDREDDYYDGDEVNDDILSWSMMYSELIAPMVKVIQDQEERISKLETVVEKLLDK